MENILHFLGFCPDAHSHPNIFYMLDVSNILLITKNEVSNWFGNVKYIIKTLIIK